MFFQIGIWHRSQLVRRKEAVSVAVHLSPRIEFFKKKYGNLKHTWETSSCFFPNRHEANGEKKKTSVMNSEFAYVLYTSYYKDDWIKGVDITWVETLLAVGLSAAISSLNIATEIGCLFLTNVIRNSSKHEPDLHKRHYFINQYKNKHSFFCRRSSHNYGFRE